MSEEQSAPRTQAQGAPRTQTQGAPRTQTQGAPRTQTQSGRRPPQQSRGYRGRRPQRRGYSNRRFQRRKKVCAFCVEKSKTIDYKDLSTMRRFLTARGKIKNRRKSGNCAKHQRRLAVAVKRARHLSLLPFTAEHIRRY